jgi:sugar phosphate isomerase/epimerase
MRFGISTHLFHAERLDRPHLERVAAAGFDLVELFATRSHLDYRDPASVARVAGWLDGLSLSAWSLHLPICDGFTGGQWGRAYSNASLDAARRQEAVSETVAAVLAARDLGCRVAVLHLGLPDGQPIPTGDNDAGAARRSLDPIAAACDDAGVRLALEVIPNHLATADALVGWMEDDIDLGSAGVCLDFGHAHLTGGAPEAVEQLAGHLLTTHVHDNRGRHDDHLVPFDGTIDWPATLMALAKVGYQGPLVFEIPDHGDVTRVLERTAAAEHRIQVILKDLAQPFEFSED